MMSDLGDAPDWADQLVDPDGPLSKPCEPAASPEPGVDGRGRLLHMPEILALTGMADGTVRSRYHSGTMPPMWKLGRRLVAWERELIGWLDAERERTSKSAPPQA